MSLDIDALSEIALTLVEEAITKGTLHLVNSHKVYELEAQDIVALAKWLSTSKAKKPRPVTTPEDFILRKTSSDESSS